MRTNKKIRTNIAALILAGALTVSGSAQAQSTPVEYEPGAAAVQFYVEGSDTLSSIVEDFIWQTASAFQPGEVDRFTDMVMTYFVFGDVLGHDFDDLTLLLCNNENFEAALAVLLCNNENFETTLAVLLCNNENFEATLAVLLCTEAGFGATGFYVDGRDALGFSATLPHNDGFRVGFVDFDDLTILLRAARP